MWKDYSFHLWLLVMDKTPLIDILSLARTSKKFYDMIEYYLKYNKYRFNIPKEHTYNSDIHWLCENWICKRCFKCGNDDCFHYYRNWNLKICKRCLPIRFNPQRYNYYENPIVEEHDIKGFTLREIRTKLKYNYDASSERLLSVRVYHKSDIAQITKNRYGFNEYDDYLKYVKHRFNCINHRIFRKNIEKIGIKHVVTDYIRFKKSNSGFFLELTKKDIEKYKRKINFAIIRYDLCKEMLEDNERVYEDIREFFINKGMMNDEYQAKIMTYLRLKNDFIFVFNIESKMMIDYLDYDIFYEDRCFHYFKRYRVNKQRAINSILNIDLV